MEGDIRATLSVKRKPITYSSPHWLHYRSLYRTIALIGYTTGARVVQQLSLATRAVLMDVAALDF